ncbi:alanine racemase [Sulfuricella denitrificans skB26]|uniref:Alanine racemase n=1 Tax=Sulfuricella denitrificans (strain DSM 22764 / NBRC 105220 / skB26) TaxID=1163617 RepID=S6ACI1_SULDS|nr:alanine racemase [Sulfuricella denitrificans]BAN35598.1 alanine racemase [Sulfuricella denitrificans skB26]
MTRPLQAQIDLSALKHNLGVVRGHAPQSRTMAVIKANSYGHGMLRVAHALDTADGYAVLNVEEAVALREAGFNQTILLLEGFFSVDELPTLAEYRLASVIHCPEQIEMLEMSGLPVKLDVFLKLNSGMNRLGFRPEAFGAALQRLQAARAVGRITLMTHFSCADEAQGIATQLACFDTLAAGLDAPRSLANSAAILRYPQAHGDWVRPGIMLYGSSPFADASAASLDLKPVMTLTSAIIGVQELQVGEAVGYGAAFRAEQPARVGIVACGYADGYPRHAPTGTPVLVNGQRSRILGRVSMDMLCVDLSGIPGAGIGSPVTLWGKGLPVEEIAAAAGTISYELLCALAARVPVVEI